jgi:hypothetical protein
MSSPVNKEVIQFFSMQLKQSCKNPKNWKKIFVTFSIFEDAVIQNYVHAVH